MSFGFLTPEMIEAIKPLVKGKTVWDFGAGDLTYSYLLLKWGASKVIAVDKNLQDPEEDLVEFKQSYFKDLPVESRPVLWLSWPQVPGIFGEPDLLKHLKEAETVLYLGSNTDLNACGGLGMFEHFSERKLVAHVPHRKNVLMAYGSSTVSRKLVGEEFAALHPMTYWSFSDVYPDLT